MDYKLLVFVFLATITVALSQDLIRCYQCNRWQVAFLNGGDDEDECEFPIKDDAPMSGRECTACLTDTRSKTFGWIERKCVREGLTCKDGIVTKSFVEILELDDVTEYDVERKCCTENLCNDSDFDVSAAGRMRTPHFLFAAALICFRFLF